MAERLEEFLERLEDVDQNNEYDMVELLEEISIDGSLDDFPIWWADGSTEVKFATLSGAGVNFLNLEGLQQVVITLIEGIKD